MEDAHITQEIDLPDGKKGMLFAVFDGHGGKEVAQFADKHFKNILREQPKFKAKNYKEALRQSFFDIDALIGKEDYGTDTGTTACVVLFTDSHIWTVNAGDSRGVLARTDAVVALSEDHKPDNTIEIRRIEAA